MAKKEPNFVGKQGKSVMSRTKSAPAVVKAGGSSKLKQPDGGKGRVVDVRRPSTTSLELGRKKGRKG